LNRVHLFSPSGIQRVGISIGSEEVLSLEIDDTRVELNAKSEYLSVAKLNAGIDHTTLRNFVFKAKGGSINLTASDKSISGTFPGGNIAYANKVHLFNWQKITNFEFNLEGYHAEFINGRRGKTAEISTESGDSISVEVGRRRIELNSVINYISLSKLHAGIDYPRLTNIDLDVRIGNQVITGTDTSFTWHCPIHGDLVYENSVNLFDWRHLTKFDLETHGIHLGVERDGATYLGEISAGSGETISAEVDSTRVELTGESEYLNLSKLHAGIDHASLRNLALDAKQGNVILTVRDTSLRWSCPTHGTVVYDNSVHLLDWRHLTNFDVNSHGVHISIVNDGEIVTSEISVESGDTVTLEVDQTRIELNAVISYISLSKLHAGIDYPTLRNLVLDAKRGNEILTASDTSLRWSCPIYGDIVYENSVSLLELRHLTKLEITSLGYHLLLVNDGTTVSTEISNESEDGGRFALDVDKARIELNAESAFFSLSKLHAGIDYWTGRNLVLDAKSGNVILTASDTSYRYSDPVHGDIVYENSVSLFDVRHLTTLEVTSHGHHVLIGNDGTTLVLTATCPILEVEKFHASFDYVHMNNFNLDAKILAQTITASDNLVTVVSSEGTVTMETFLGSSDLKRIEIRSQYLNLEFIRDQSLKIESIIPEFQIEYVLQLTSQFTRGTGHLIFRGYRSDLSYANRVLRMDTTIEDLASVFVYDPTDGVKVALSSELGNLTVARNVIDVQVLRPFTAEFAVFSHHGSGYMTGKTCGKTCNHAVTISRTNGVFSVRPIFTPPPQVAF
jgi:hypothetical protein